MVKDHDGWLESHFFSLSFSLWDTAGKLNCLQTHSLKDKLVCEARFSFIYAGVDVGGKSQAG